MYNVLIINTVGLCICNIVFYGNILWLLFSIIYVLNVFIYDVYLSYRLQKKAVFPNCEKRLKYIFEISKHAYITHNIYICFVSGDFF